jgi:hypothetical protein
MPLLERDRPLAVLSAAVERAVGGGGSVVAVLGEAGSGRHRCSTIWGGGWERACACCVAKAGAHREAAAHYRAALLESLAYECYLTVATTQPSRKVVDVGIDHSLVLATHGGGH